MRLEEIGLIGNGQYAAHVARNGSVVWCCLKGCNVPPVWQDAVIRSPLALRLHFFEDTVDGREDLDEALRARSPLGLLSEDYAPGVALWGNYPQAYSHVGLMHAAFEASPAWKDVL